MRQTVNKPNDEEIKQIAKKNFKKWNDALQTKDSQEVAKCYLSQGELFGTVSGKIRQGREAIAEYFEHFLESDPSGEILESDIEVISEDAYLETGIYQFTLTKDGKKTVVKARFTYVWQKDDDGEWRILHHHSGVKGEINEALTDNEDLKLYELTEDVERGLDENLGGGYALKTGFAVDSENDRKIRFTYLLKDEKVVSQQLSEAPKNNSDF